MISDNHGKKIEIVVKGKVQFVVGATKIDRVIEAKESILFKFKPVRIVS